jgi:hypothetical protein
VGALNSLLFHTFGDGRCYRQGELIELFAAAGLQRVRVLRPLRLPGNVLVVGFAR